MHEPKVPNFVDLGKQVAVRCFTMTDQHAFSELSGDTNPLHLDPIAARRTQAGQPVVHGIHALLWTLECLAGNGLPLDELCQVKVQFNRFMYLERQLVLQVRRADAAMVRVEVLADGLPAMVVTLRFGPRGAHTVAVARVPVAASDAPEALTLEKMADRSGWLSPPVAPDAFASAFPEAANVLRARRLSGLAQLSRLVGMVCPGLHSIFASLVVDLTDEATLRDGMGFAVAKVDDRFRLVDMEVEGEGLHGKVAAFARREPVRTPVMADITRHVRPDEFAGTTTLVAGGSRGLGALTAKLIAAGGGQVVVTYATGREDAETLQKEINFACDAASCRIQAFDATQPVAPQFEMLPDGVSRLSYYATPQIFVQKSALFMPDLYAAFSRVYVDAFYALCRFLPRNDLSVFYPSSIAVTTQPADLMEYAMAKQAGETLCAGMVASMPGLRILVDRLPRVLTDQTATVAIVENADPLEILLPLVRATMCSNEMGVPPA